MAGFSNGFAGGVKNGNGKRERVDQEDDQEFMPLSKRINNIHLSPERLINGHVGNSATYLHTNGVSGPVAHHSLANGYNGVHIRQTSHNQHQSHGFRGPAVDINDFSESSGDGRGSFHSSSPEHNINYQNPSASAEVPVMSIQSSDLGSSNDYSNFQYRPSLNLSANPHYYESNRALFELYIERQLRTNQTPHPNVFGPPTTNGVN